MGAPLPALDIQSFFSEGQTHILPRPYQTSKPNNKGHSLIREEWMQSFLKAIECHVLHYLHNLCDDQIQKKLALLHIELSKRLIPECLRLGDTCFTHMSVFGTLNKQGGQMPLHFDERDIISCVFHLGKVSKGGATLYFDGDSPNKPGKQVYKVPFNHGTLQIGFFSEVLHGIEDWEGQRCGIQVNIKRDLLKHFIKYGTVHYNKYRYTGYPQGPVVFFLYKLFFTNSYNIS